MYCPVDRRNVETKRGYNLVLLIILLIFVTIIGIIYFIVKRKRICPYCKTKEDKLQPPIPEGQMGAVGAQGAMGGAQQSYPCPTCGKPLTWNAQQNKWWCAAENKWV